MKNKKCSCLHLQGKYLKSVWMAVEAYATRPYSIPKAIFGFNIIFHAFTLPAFMT